MALTLDGTAQMPSFGGTSGSGVGLGAVGGGVAGLILGSLFANRNGGLFGGSGDNVAYDGLQTQIAGLQNQISSGGVHSEINELEN